VEPLTWPSASFRRSGEWRGFAYKRGATGSNPVAPTYLYDSLPAGMPRWRASFRWSGPTAGSGEWCTAGRAGRPRPAVMGRWGVPQQSVSCRLYLIIFGAGGRQGVWPRRVALVVACQLILSQAGCELPETCRGQRLAVMAEISYGCVVSVRARWVRAGSGKCSWPGWRGCRAAPGVLVAGAPGAAGRLAIGWPWSPQSPAAAPAF
jgi:hypothetical protein